MGDLTSVGTGGSSLSGGQRLRIGVARAVYAAWRCPVLLLDDPFSALDGATSTRVMRFLREIVARRQRRVVILTTHSLHLLGSNREINQGAVTGTAGGAADGGAAADEVTGVLVLDGGVEVERGTFADLQRSSSLFRSMLGNEQGKAHRTRNTALDGRNLNSLQPPYPQPQNRPVAEEDHGVVGCGGLEQTHSQTEADREEAGGADDDDDENVRGGEMFVEVASVQSDTTSCNSSFRFGSFGEPPLLGVPNLLQSEERAAARGNDRGY